MKKKILFICSNVLFCLSTSVYSQQPFTEVLYDSAEVGIQAHSVVRSFDNGYLLAGESMYDKGLIIKTDSAGNVLWNKRYDGPGNTSFYHIIVTNDSCFALAGITGNDALCIKINSSGDTIWSKKIEISGYYISANCVQQTFDSGYVLTGYCSGISGLYSVFAAKLTSAGNLEWAEVLTGGNNSNIGNSVKQTADSGYIITGYLENYPPFEPNAFLLKLLPSGAFDWGMKYHLFNNAGICMGNDVQVTDYGLLCYFYADVNIAMVATDFSGQILWSKLYQYFGGPLFINDPPFKMHETHDHSYILLNRGGGSGGITKVDSAGNTLWTQDLFQIAGDVSESADSGFFIVGNGPVMGITITPPPYSPQIGIIKTDSLGNAPNCVNPYSYNLSSDSLIFSSVAFSLITGGVDSVAGLIVDSIKINSQSGCVEFLGSVNDYKSDNDISVYPNPSSGIFTVSGVMDEQVWLIIYSTLGEIVYENKIGSLPYSIELKSLIEGIYFYKAILPHEKYETGKLIIAH